MPTAMTMFCTLRIALEIYGIASMIAAAWNHFTEPPDHGPANPDDAPWWVPEAEPDEPDGESDLDSTTVSEGDVFEDHPQRESWWDAPDLIFLCSDSGTHCCGIGLEAQGWRYDRCAECRR